MLNKYLSLALCFSLVIPVYSFNQDSEYFYPPTGNGIAIEYGIGKLSIRDEYISKEKYSGNIPYFRAAWSQIDKSEGYAIGLHHRNSSDIMNYNMRADITEFSLFFDKFHRNKRILKSFPKLLNYLGPSLEFYTIFFDQKVAGNGLNASFSFFSMFSLAANSRHYYSVADKLWVVGGVRASLISVGLRMVDFTGSDEEPLGILHLFSASKVTTNVGLLYKISDNISARLAYKFQFLRLQEWDPILSASDNITVDLKYNF
ncbi:MAG: hypothetical protein H8E26_12610 [FCB group bacterium]|nr:hypothetical protein [FCB group bacterium]MBL7121144.1 hypothetical protein [Candidatus Neomarinimicrobiota bacterium]